MIDAIRINQQDLVERGSQVGFMGEVRRYAKGVLAWLGEATNIKGDGSLHPIGRLSLRHVAEAARDERALALKRAPLDSLPHWYSRCWVVQEYILSERERSCVLLQEV